MDQGHCLVVLNRQSAASHDIAVAVHIQTAVQAVLVYTRAYGDRYKVAGVIQLVPQGSTSRPLPDCRPRRWGAGACHTGVLVDVDLAAARISMQMTQRCS